MKLVINLEKKYLFGLLLAGLIFIGMVGVFAYNSSGTGGVPSTFGHSVDEIDWSKPISGNVSASGFCIGSSCITSWAGIGGNVSGSSWATSGSNLYYSLGNVGIGTSTPSQKLDVSGNVRASGFCNSTSCVTSLAGGGYLPGMHCGVFADGVDYEGTVLCYGVNPRDGCPSGFVRAGGDYDSSDDRHFYTCVKT